MLSWVLSGGGTNGFSRVDRGKVEGRFPALPVHDRSDRVCGFKKVDRHPPESKDRNLIPQCGNPF